MTILTDEDIGELKRDYGFGICDLNWCEATRAIEAAVIERIKSRGAVWMQSNHYQLANNNSFLCRCAPSQVHNDDVPLYRIED